MSDPVAYRFKSPLSEEGQWEYGKEPPVGTRWEVEPLFTEDWDRINALRASLREHMSEIHRLRAALADLEQEPVGWVSTQTLARLADFDGIIYATGGFDDAVALYAHPPQRAVLLDQTGQA